jgi:hypothetical protein
MRILIINDDYNSVLGLWQFLPEEVEKIDIFEDLRKSNYGLENIKEEINANLSQKDTDHILILDIELSTGPRYEGIRLLKWFRGEGYRQFVFIYTDYVCQLNQNEAKTKLIEMGLDEALIWQPLLDSQLRDSTVLRNVLDSANPITEEQLKTAQKTCEIPWRYEYFLELSLRLLALDNEENVAVVKKILFGDTAEVEQYEAVCGQFQPYEEVCSLSDNETFQFSELKDKVSKFLRDYDKNNILSGQNEYQKHYNEIYELLLKLCNKQRESK